MARYSDYDAKAIYEIADTWRTACLIEGKSLLWKGEDIWSEQNLRDFKKYFIEKPDLSKSTFDEKFKKQLEPGGLGVTKLACELILVYFLFTSSVTGKRKRELITLIASWKDIKIEAEGDVLLNHLKIGIGGPGLAYNLRRPFEIAYIAEFALELTGKPKTDREKTLSDHLALRTLIDGGEKEETRQSRDILLHLLFPDQYERIASSAHKQLISETFIEILDKDKVPEDLDDKLLAIRTKLEQLLPGERLDFYWKPLRGCWYVSGEEDDLSPLQGLSVKRQIVLYGPPGTGKTFEAQALADRLIRQSILHAWGPKRYFEDVEKVNEVVKDRNCRVQFHPGYSYEDLIRGLRLSDGGKTDYSDGTLLRVITDIQKDPPELKDVPFVLIMDEMNRADLSKVLGECFSLMEDRDAEVQLAGQDEKPRKISFPPKLHLIGTMNLIDQSLEQVDFALRRRFLWFPRGFDRDQFLEITQYRRDALHKDHRLKKEWGRFAPEFEVLADRAEAINREIEKHPSLGPQYQIGHTYFCDVVNFIEKELTVRPGRRFVLYSPKGNGLDKTVGVLWKYSLKPLLEQYLSGIDTAERQGFLGKAEEILLRGNTA